MASLTVLIGNFIYFAQAVVAFWGAYCLITVWRRTDRLRFPNEARQDGFLTQLDQQLKLGHFDDVADQCMADRRAVPQLCALAIKNRDLGISRVRQLVADRFQRDVLADFDYRLSWVNTVIKTEPMLGLFGTVIGMMGAFSNISQGEKVDPTRLATDISIALLTTAIGLAIAIPLMIAMASVNVRIRKLEDLVGLGLTRFFERFRAAVSAPLVGARR